MPHATALHQSEDEHDTILIQQVLDAPTTEDPFGLNRDLEPGEKAEDAVDFEDISDDDLAEDEDAVGEREPQTGGGHQNGASSKSETFAQDVNFPASTNGKGLEDNAYEEDLFGEVLSSPVETDTAQAKIRIEHEQHGPSNTGRSTSPQAQILSHPTSPSSRQVEAPGIIGLGSAMLNSKESTSSKELQRQQELLAMSRTGAANTDALPAPPENREELLASLWPKFERNTIPRFMDLLPPKRARYLGKSIPKPPKPLCPSKVNLELTLDQEKSFKVSSTVSKPHMDESSSQGIVIIQDEVVIKKNNEEDNNIESDFENELVRGISWQDLQIICEDWDTRSTAESVGSDEGSSSNRKPRNIDIYQELGHDRDRDRDHERPPTKVSQYQNFGQACSHSPTATEIGPFRGQHNARFPTIVPLVPGSRASNFKDCQDHYTRP